MRIHADLYGPTETACVYFQTGERIDPKLRRHIHGSKPFVKKIHAQADLPTCAAPRTYVASLQLHPTPILPYHETAMIQEVYYVRLVYEHRVVGSVEEGCGGAWKHCIALHRTDDARASPPSSSPIERAQRERRGTSRANHVGHVPGCAIATHVWPAARLRACSLPMQGSKDPRRPLRSSILVCPGWIRGLPFFSIKKTWIESYLI